MSERSSPASPIPTRVIYFLNSFRFGGAEIGLVRLVKGGVFSGCDLRIVTIVHGEGDQAQELRELGYPVNALVDRKTMRLVDLPLAAIRFRKLIAAERPKILILSLPQANLIGRMLAGSRTTVISFEHNTQLSKWLYELGYRLTSGRVDWMFADCEATAAGARKRLYRATPARTVIVPLVSFDASPLSRPPDARGRRFRIVNTARFTTAKNQDALIAAVGQLVKSGRDVELTLFGDGARRSAYRQLGDSLGLGSRLNMPGFVANWTKEAQADLFVLCSRHEGQCIVVLEAMNAGIPVLAPLIGGLIDYGSEEVMGVLSSTDPAIIAAAIGDVMDNPARASQRAIAAARMVQERYGKAAVEAAYVRINRDLLETASRL